MKGTNNLQPLNSAVQFNITEAAFERLTKAHLKLIGQEGGISPAVTARICFMRGLDKIEHDQKRGLSHIRKVAKRSKKQPTLL